MDTTTRRAFLGQSALAVGGLALAGRAYSHYPGPNDRIRLGIIGCGGMGKGDLATFFFNPEVDCPVVCDVDDAMIAQAVNLVEKQRGKAPETVKDFRRVLDRKDIDVVLIATPDHWHALPTVMACQAGKDVYVEKPLATTIAEGHAMLEASKKHGRVVQMGTHWRSGVHFAQAADLIRSGRLGKVRSVRCWAYHDWLGDIGIPPDGPVPAGVDYDMWLGPAPKRPFNPNRFHFNFRWFWDYAGGLMTDWGVHLLNLVLWSMGPEPPRSVTSTGGKFVLKDNSETPDTQVTLYDFPGYSLIWEHQVGTSVGPNNRSWGIWFSGSEGTLILDDAGFEVIPERKKKSLTAMKAPGGPDARLAHVRNFLDCVRSREAPVENLEVGHFVSTVAHLGNIAFRTGKQIHWDAASEKITGDPEAERLAYIRYRRPWTLPYMPVRG